METTYKILLGALMYILPLQKYIIRGGLREISWEDIFSADHIINEWMNE